MRVESFAFITALPPPLFLSFRHTRLIFQLWMCISILFILYSFGHALDSCVCARESVYGSIMMNQFYVKCNQTTTLFAQKNEKPQRIEMMIICCAESAFCYIFLRLSHFILPNLASSLYFSHLPSCIAGSPILTTRCVCVWHKRNGLSHAIDRYIKNGYDELARWLADTERTYSVCVCMMSRWWYGLELFTTYTVKHIVTLLLAD